MGGGIGGRCGNGLAGGKVWYAKLAAKNLRELAIAASATLESKHSRVQAARAEALHVAR